MLMRSAWRLALSAVTILALAGSAWAGGTLRVALTATDVPTTTGAPDNGGEGMRFLGFPVFESLVLWDLTRADKLAEIRPGLAESWEQDKNDKTKWIFHLRQRRQVPRRHRLECRCGDLEPRPFLQADAPQFDPPNAAVTQARDPYHRQLPKDRRVHDRDRQPAADQLLPEHGHLVLYVSPAQFEKVGVLGRSSPRQPAGTGPFKIIEFKPRVSASLARNDEYWDKTRVPKLDKIVCVPDAGGDDPAIAALRSGQVDWIEVPPPDAVPSLKPAGFEIVANSYPHAWPWTFNLRREDSPFRDIRVRHAINYCVNRDGLVTVAERHGRAGVRLVQEGRPVFRQAEAAVHLRSGQGQGAAERGRLRPGEAGEGQDHDHDQRLGPDAAAADERVPAAELEGVQFRHLFRGGRLGHDAGGVAQPADRAAGARRRRDEHQPAHLDRHLAICPVQPLPAILPPKGRNWPNWKNREFDALIDKIEKSTDPEEILANIQKAHEIFVDDPPWLFIVHDRNASGDDQERQRLRQRAELVPGLHHRLYGVGLVHVVSFVLRASGA